MPSHIRASHPKGWAHCGAQEEREQLQAELAAAEARERELRIRLSRRELQIASLTSERDALATAAAEQQQRRAAEARLEEELQCRALELQDVEQRLVDAQVRGRSKTPKTLRMFAVGPWELREAAQRSDGDTVWGCSYPRHQGPGVQSPPMCSQWQGIRLPPRGNRAFGLECVRLRRRRLLQERRVSRSSARHGDFGFWVPLRCGPSHPLRHVVRPMLRCWHRSWRRPAGRESMRSKRRRI
jgi:hypothetical protein